MMLLFPALPVNASTSRNITIIINEMSDCQESESASEETVLAEDSREEETSEENKEENPFFRKKELSESEKDFNEFMIFICLIGLFLTLLFIFLFCDSIIFFASLIMLVLGGLFYLFLILCVVQ